MNRFLVSNHRLTRDLDLRLAELSREHRRAEDANMAKTRFLAHAGHDLRQPVHAIAMMTAVLQQYQLEPGAMDLATRIGTSLETLGELFQSLLDISALNLNRVSARMKPVDLGALIEQLALRNAPMIEEHGAAIKLVPTAQWVETDPRILAIILQNLLTNAANHATGSKVLLGIRRRGDRVSVIVADAGPGIPEAEQELVFQEFYRGDDAAGAYGTGMGLGLPLVMQFSRILGLSCRISSSARKGTLFEISGLRPTNRVDIRHSPGPAAIHRLAGARVHVVDADTDLTQIIVPLLESWDCQVTTGSKIAPAAIGADLVIMKCDPGEDAAGQEQLEIIRDQDRRPIPVLMVTGAGALDTNRMKRLDLVQVISGPVRPAKLRAALLSLLLQQQELTP